MALKEAMMNAHSGKSHVLVMHTVESHMCWSCTQSAQATRTAVALVNWQVKETPVQFKDGEQRFEMVGSSHSKV